MADSATEAFAEINQRMQSDPSRLKGVNAKYAFDLTGDNGGQYHMNISDGTGDAGEGAPDSPNITITMKAEDFLQLYAGKMDPTMAFMSGKIKIKGDMGLAMKLQSLMRNG